LGAAALIRDGDLKAHVDRQSQDGRIDRAVGRLLLRFGFRLFLRRFRLVGAGLRTPLLRRDRRGRRDRRNNEQHGREGRHDSLHSYSWFCRSRGDSGKGSISRGAGAAIGSTPICAGSAGATPRISDMVSAGTLSDGTRGKPSAGAGSTAAVAVTRCAPRGRTSSRRRSAVVAVRGVPADADCVDVGGSDVGVAFAIVAPAVGVSGGAPPSRRARTTPIRITAAAATGSPAHRIFRLKAETTV